MRNALLAALLCLPLAACCSAKLKTASDGIEQYTNVILPRYEKYLDADPTLDEKAAGITPRERDERIKTKAAAKETAERLRAFLKTMRED